MSLTRLGDGLRLSLGTLTVVRVPPPRRVDRAVAAVAMALAPLAVLPLAVAAAGVALAADRAGLPPLVGAVLVVGVLALGTRVLHWDGVADTADGLTASYDRERSLAVMRSGDVGPAGTVAVVLLAGLQVAALTSLLPHEDGWLAVGLLVVASRSALAPVCVRGVPPARTEGLGSLHVGSVPVAAAVTGAIAGAALAGLAAGLVGPVWLGLVGALVAAAGVLGLVLRCVRRLGGVTGDVLGACVELSFAVLLTALSAG